MTNYIERRDIGRQKYVSFTAQWIKDNVRFSMQDAYRDSTTSASISWSVKSTVGWAGRECAMRKKLSMYLKYALLSSLALLMISCLGLGVRAFATADATGFILSGILVISVAIFVLYFMLRRPTRELTVHSLFRESHFVKRSPSPRLSTIDRNPLTLDPSRAALAVVKTARDSLIFRDKSPLQIGR